MEHRVFNVQQQAASLSINTSSLPNSVAVGKSSQSKKVAKGQGKKEQKKKKKAAPVQARQVPSLHAQTGSYTIISTTTRQMQQSFVRPAAVPPAYSPRQAPTPYHNPPYAYQPTYPTAQAPGQVYQSPGPVYQPPGVRFQRAVAYRPSVPILPGMPPPAGGYQPPGMRTAPVHRPPYFASPSPQVTYQHPKAQFSTPTSTPTARMPLNTSYLSSPSSLQPSGLHHPSSSTPSEVPVPGQLPLSSRPGATNAQAPAFTVSASSKHISSPPTNTAPPSGGDASAGARVIVSASSQCSSSPPISSIPPSSENASLSGTSAQVPAYKVSTSSKGNPPTNSAPLSCGDAPLSSSSAQTSVFTASTSPKDSTSGDASIFSGVQSSNEPLQAPVSRSLQNREPCPSVKDDEDTVTDDAGPEILGSMDKSNHSEACRVAEETQAENTAYTRIGIDSQEESSEVPAITLPANVATEKNAILQRNYGSPQPTELLLAINKLSSNPKITDAGEEKDIVNRTDTLEGNGNQESDTLHLIEPEEKSSYDVSGEDDRKTKPESSKAKKGTRPSDQRKKGKKAPREKVKSGHPVDEKAQSYDLVDAATIPETEDLKEMTWIDGTPDLFTDDQKGQTDSEIGDSSQEKRTLLVSEDEVAKSDPSVVDTDKGAETEEVLDVTKEKTASSSRDIQPHERYANQFHLLPPLGNQESKPELSTNGQTNKPEIGDDSQEKRTLLVSEDEVAKSDPSVVDTDKGAETEEVLDVTKEKTASSSRDIQPHERYANQFHLLPPLGNQESKPELSTNGQTNKPSGPGNNFESNPGPSYDSPQQKVVAQNVYNSNGDNQASKKNDEECVPDTLPLPSPNVPPQHAFPPTSHFPHHIPGNGTEGPDYGISGWDNQHSEIPEDNMPVDRDTDVVKPEKRQDGTRKRITVQIYEDIINIDDNTLENEKFTDVCCACCGSCSDFLCQSCSCSCSVPFSKNKDPNKPSVSTKKLLPTDVMLKGRARGIKNLGAVVFPLVSDLIRLIWVIIEMALSLTGLILSIITLSLDQNRAFNILHFVLGVVTGVLALIDGVYVIKESETVVKIGQKIKACCCKFKGNEDGLEEKLVDESDKASQAEKNCCKKCCFKCFTGLNNVFDFLRILLSEALFYPLLICDLFEVIVGQEFSSAGDIIGIILFIVSMISFILTVYVARIVVLIGILKNATAVHTPPKEIENKGSDYDEKFKQSACYYQTSFLVHVVLQMLAQTMMYIAIAAKIRYDNRHFYVEGNTNESIYVSSYLWYMIIAGYVLPTMGLLTFFIVTYYWSQQYPIGFHLNMMSIFKMTEYGTADMFHVKNMIKEKSQQLLDSLTVQPGEKKAKIFANMNKFFAVTFQPLKKDFKDMFDKSLLVKFLFPFQAPGLVVICFIYFALQFAFIICAAQATNEMGEVVTQFLNGGGWVIYYLFAVVVGIIANLYTFLVVGFWLAVLFVILVIIAGILGCIALALILCVAAVMCSGSSSQTKRSYI